MILYIEHSRNFGSQNAFISGMQLATGDAVILLDGDLQDPPELIDAFYAKWRQGYDVVYGRRVKREGQPLLGFFAGVFYRVFRCVSQVPMPVGAGDFALMDRKVVDALLTLPETDQFRAAYAPGWVFRRWASTTFARSAPSVARTTTGETTCGGRRRASFRSPLRR